MLFDPPEVGEDHSTDAEDLATAKRVRDTLLALRVGVLPPKIEPDVRFYVLGLSPNASRLSVRFWQVSSAGKLFLRVGQHLSDLAINRQYPNEPETPSLWMLLKELAPQRKLDNIPPALVGPLMRAVLLGTPYPRGLLAAVLMRLRADRNVNYLRAALIKAFLVRMNRTLHFLPMEVSMALNTETQTPAYLLGRLFAVLEKAQKDAIPGAGATIRDRYYGAASATPRAVFPQLLRLAQHHIQKAKYGSAIDRRIAEIVDGLEAFPAHLSMEDQGLFALGYYQQRNDLYTSKQNLQDDANKEEQG